MFVFLIENTCVLYGIVPFQQIGGILMGIKRDPRIANLFLYSLHADYKQGLMRKCEKKLAVSFYFPLHCIDDVSASVNNSEFSDFVDCIYTVERHIKDTTYTLRSASYIDVYLEINNNRPRTKQYYNRDDFNLPIVDV